MAGKTLRESLSQEEIKNIIYDYKNNNVSLRELEKKYHHGRRNLSRLLEELGVKTTKGNHYRKYFHNEDFFEVIDTEEKAYWLGFMFADGYILSKREVKEERREYSYYYRTNSNPQTIKFYHYLYDDAIVFMKRKYDKFQELLDKYDENRGN